MNKKEKRRVFLYGMGGAILLFTLLLALHFFENPGEMRFPAIVPDGTENALGAYNFYRYGKFQFSLNHIWHPVRYPIFCQLVIFLPGIILSGGEMVWGVMGVWASLLLAGVSLFLIGKRCGNAPAGLIAAGVLALIAEIHFLANSAMTEIPYMGFLTATALCFLLYWKKLEEGKKGKLLYIFSLFSGVILALAGGIRPTAFPMIFLFFLAIFLAGKSWKERIFLGLLLSLPSFFQVLGTLFYQYKVFGSPFRTGYHYWCPIPYDFPTLPFSLSYMSRSWERFANSWNLYILLLSPLLFLLSLKFSPKGKEEKYRKMQKRFFLFALTQMGIILFLYMPYCGFVTRYCVGASTLLLLSAILSAASIFRHIFPLFSLRRGLFYALELGLAFLFLAGGYFLLRKEKKVPVTYTEKEFLLFCDQLLPQNATLISNFNPALTELYFVEKSPQRAQLPLARHLEYTDKVISSKSIFGKIPLPPKDDDHMLAYKAPGTRLPFPQVLAETLPHKWTGKEKFHFRPLPASPSYITNLALYQIPRELQKSFFQHFYLEKVLEKPPMTLYRVHNRK